MITSIILTRYLYVLDETLFSLQESMLKGESFDETLFWTGEIYYTGYPDLLWKFIFEFYYNFCAITHPKYEKKLTKLHTLYHTKQCISNIMTAITILFYTKKDYTVFKHWYLKPKIPNKTYIGRDPNWYKTLNIVPQCKNLIRSIHKENWHNVVFYLRYLDPKITYKAVKKYFTCVHKLTLADDSLDAIPYNCKSHIILTLIHHLRTDEKIIQTKRVFRAYRHKQFAAAFDESNKPVRPVYKTLPNKLKYTINDRIGCFPLQRYAVDLNNIYWYLWEYYAYMAPLWKNRFGRYKIKVDDDKKRIIFEDDDEYEEFCKNYYYESDEQSKETQSKNIGIIPQISLETWLEDKLN